MGGSELGWVAILIPTSIESSGISCGDILFFLAYMSPGFHATIVIFMQQCNGANYCQKGWGGRGGGGKVDKIDRQ